MIPFESQAGASRISRRAGLRRARKGIAIAQVIIAISLLAALAVAQSLSASGFKSQNLRLTVDAEVSSQANLIRQRLIQCNLRYPTPGFPTVPPSGLVRDLTCPGAPTGFQQMWNAPNQPSLPRAPLHHAEWTYLNDAAGIRFRTSALPSYFGNPEIRGGHHTAWQRFHSTEADCLHNSSEATVTVWLQKTGSAPAPNAC